MNISFVLKIIPFVVSSFLVGVEPNKPYKENAHIDPPLTMEQKIDSLLQRMTLEEKIGQLVQYTGFDELTGPGEKSGDLLEKHNRIKNGHVGSLLNVISVKSTRQAQELAIKNSRLKIPMIFGYDVIHGFKTMFPIPLAESASWDLEAIELSAKIAAKEAASSGIHWTFAPMVDISRDPRWGRVMEGAGEDTYLGAKIAVARVKGFQGKDMKDPFSVAACAKHFAAYGFAEAGRDYNTVDISDYTLHNVILPPFKACADAGVATFMNAFNEIGGITSTANAYLQRDILKKEWNFQGFVVSDWGSIAEIIDHGQAANKEEASLMAITAGSDMDMEGYCYEESLQKLVNEGKISLEIIDDAVRRILRIKYQLGLMDNPYLYCDEKREKENVLTPEHLAASRDVARKSIVLLKNKGEILPLKQNLKSIAVIGPLAADKDIPLGNWRAQAVSNSAVSLLEGIQQAVGKGTKVSHAEGCKLAISERSFPRPLTLNYTDRSQIDQAVALAKTAEVVVLAIGEDSHQSGEGRSQSNIGLLGLQQELLEAVYAANKNVVVVLMNGRPLAIPWMADNVPAIVEAWHLGSEAGNAIADVLFGKYNPSGKLPMSFPRDVGQIPVYYNHKHTGRAKPKSPNEVFWAHHTDMPNAPLFPFGFGLSYTTFEYSPIRLSKNTFKQGEQITATITLKNTGKYEGTEVVQLYIRDLVGSLTRPIKELKGFQKITLKPNESKEVTFTITAKDLAYYTVRKQWESEPGDFHLFIGTNSKEVQKVAFKLE